MAWFKKKEPPKTDIPVNQVRSMRDQDIDDNRIIQTLQRDGYSSSKIFEAMNQVDSTPYFEQPNPEAPQQQSQPEAAAVAPETPGAVPAQSQVFSRPDYSQTGFKQPMEQPMNVPPYTQKSPEVEEIVESVIEEKWEEIVKDISKVVEWKNVTESKVNTLENDFTNLKEEFDRLHQAVIGKIGEYDKNILNVGAEIKAMEKVFSKVLPVFTEKVNQLADVADSIKKKTKTK